MLLSGFLMTYHYTLRSKKEPWLQKSTWISFYIRRYFRIAPLYYLLLIPAFVFNETFIRWRSLLPIPSARIAEVPPFSLHNLVYHLSFLFGIWPKYHASLVLPDWSLSLEMQFYLLFPFLMLFAARLGWVTLSITASAIWLICTSHALGLAERFVQPSPLPLSLLWFVIGMLWAASYLDTDEKRARRMILFACSLSFLSRDPHDVLLVGGVAWVLFSKGWLSLGRSASIVRMALSGRVGRFLADASYSVYLLHLLILTPIAYVLATRYHLNAGLRFAVALSVTATVSYGMAKPLALIEQSGISLGRRFSQAVSSRLERRAGREVQTPSTLGPPAFAWLKERQRITDTSGQNMR
jgi:peptidoglycan/LPS O-acetylase OafA/YrhL